MSHTVADVLARVLVSAGFGPCFGYLGHHVEPLPQALIRAGCQVVIAASETGAGYIALGLALASGRPSLTFCGGSPGLAMLVPALQVARLEGIPLLAIVGQTGSNGLPTFQNTGSSGSRDRELLSALRVTNFHLEVAEHLPGVLECAWEQLSEGVPVVITVACDVMAAPWPAQPKMAEGSPLLRVLNPWQWLDPMAASAAPQISLRPEQNVQPFRVGSYGAVVAELLALLPADTLWFGDAGQTRHSMGSELARRGIPSFHASSTGPMGWALAAAIGAACHQPARPVCCFTGDGSALMLANEWTTAVKLHLPITFVLAENGVLGGPYSRLRDTEAEHLGRLPVLNWRALAEALGLPAQCVDGTMSLAEALAALPVSGPRLLVVALPERDPAVRPPYELLQPLDR
jgi:thiamine pyrophosphate-dependent acetolactate synthase large subunit-like protein